MSSIKCLQCGLVNWATQENCKRCGTPVGAAGDYQPSYSADSYAPPSAGAGCSSAHSYQPYYGQPVNQKTGMAIASLVLSLIGCGTAPLGLIFGIIAYRKAKRYPMEYGGKGLATAGIVISSIMMFVFVPIVAAVAIPNLLAARRAANEGSALHSLRTIAIAQSRFSVEQGKPECGELLELRAKNHIDSVLAGGEKSGYKFSVVKNYDGSCDMHAQPVSRSTGTRSFFISSDEGVFRGADKFGLKADEDDPEIR